MPTLRSRVRIDLNRRSFVSWIASLCDVGTRQSLHQQLAQQWHVPDSDREVLACLNVRTAWALLLSAVDWPAGSRVLMSAVSVPAMFDLVRQFGHEPIPIDVDPVTGAARTEQIAQRVDSRTRAVLIAPLFGKPACWSEAESFCRSNRLLMIEDRAQYLPDGWSARHRSSADVLLYSFGPLKRKSALGGAIVLSRDRDLVESMRRLQWDLSNQTNFQFFRRGLRYFGLRALTNRYLAALLSRCLQQFSRHPDQVIDQMGKNKSFEGERLRQPSRAQLSMLFRRLNENSCWDADNRDRVDAWLTTLPPDLERDVDPDHLHWLVTIGSDDPDALRMNLRNERFDSGQLTRLTALGHERHCSAGAKRLIARRVIVPCYQGMTDQELARLRNLLYEESFESDPTRPNRVDPNSSFDSAIHVSGVAFKRPPNRDTAPANRSARSATTPPRSDRQVLPDAIDVPDRACPERLP